ncbi:MAG TPA: PAS domain S-box protein, partial [Cyanophyceae cyanobacterium]
MTSVFGLALLTLLTATVQVSCTSAIALISATLSWSLSIVMYYLLNRQILKNQQTEAQFQYFYNNVPCGYYTIDTDGNFIAINDTGLSWLGYSRDEVIGKLKITDLLTPESANLFQSKFPHLLEKGWVKDVEIQMVRKNGTILPVVLNSTAIRNATGHFIVTRTAVFDSTERQQAEAELRKSEQKFRQLAENIHEVFWMTDADWRQLLYVSPAYEQIWGRSCESLYGNLQSFLEAIHPDDRQRVLTHLEHNATRTFDIEYRILRPDGSIRWIKDRGFPIRNEFGEIYRRAGTAKDITEHKEVEAMLRRVNEELEIRVQERTADLKQANERLQWELLERKRVEDALR